MAYATGSAGKSGGAAVAGGMAGVGRAAGGAAMSPLRKAADSARSNFRDGARASVGNMGGRIVPAPGSTPPDPVPESGPPAWARSMKQRQSLGHSASLAAHTVRSGDGHGAGASIDTQEKD
jgi:type IV secretion system protein TrbL